ncbi:N-6 DNA methylase [Bacteroidota bacterium]
MANGTAPKQVKLTSQELKSFLWDAANILRGRIDSGEFKHYIFGLLFFKRLSDVFEEEYSKMVDKVGKKLARDEHLYGEIFYIPNGCSWDDILNTSTNIGEKINDVFVQITRANVPRLDGILDKIDFNDKDRLPDEAVHNLVNHFNMYKLGSKNVTGDLLGDAYEYLIAQFADDAGKKGGEFYTPHMVVKLLVQILKPDEHHSIDDPASGSGGMLITSGQYLKELGKNPHKLFLYGQERVYTTYIIAKMNMILHGFNDAKIARGDTFTEPRHLNPDGSLMKFDIVMANPPWNLDNWMHEVSNNNGKKTKKDIEDKYNRFIYGRPPAGSADWAWLQHMYASLKPGGRMGIVMDNGVLFRGGKEGIVRKAFIENDLVDAVIGLPSNLFANTGSPGCLLICNTKKPAKRKGRILFIDASKDFLEGKAQNHLREEDVAKTLKAYEKFESVERYCSVCELDEIKENDYNLNISRYVDTTEPEVIVDISACLDNLKKLEADRTAIDKKLTVFLKELGFNK